MNDYMGYGILGLIIIFLIVCIKREMKKAELFNRSYHKAMEKISEKNKIIGEMENEIRQYEYFSTSLCIFKGYKAVKIVKNKVGELYIVMQKLNDVLLGESLNFYLSGERHKGIGNCPRILSTIVNDYIWIDDFFAIDENCGNGTLLLKCLFDKARELKINRIKGQLSRVDINKFDKLEYFYEKNGFEVSFNLEHTEGYIERKVELYDRYIE